MEDTLEICLDTKLYQTLDCTDVFVLSKVCKYWSILHERNDNRSYAKINLKRLGFGDFLKLLILIQYIEKVFCTCR